MGAIATRGHPLRRLSELPLPILYLFQYSAAGWTACVFVWVYIAAFAFSIACVNWTYFCVPETKGVPIEEMDMLFGGNSGEADLQRIAQIRAHRGVSVGIKEAVSHVENA
ncbi:hypothetical protein AWENTII_006264 [Aspergillus wentii]